MLTNLKNNIMIGNFDFLKSRRFWALAIIAILEVLAAEGIIPSNIVEPIKTLLLSFVVVGTVDKLPKALNGLK